MRRRRRARALRRRRTAAPPSSTCTSRSRPSSTSASRWWCSRALPPFRRQCSRIAASVSAPRARTARSANVRSVSSSGGVGASRTCFGMTRSVEVVEPLEAAAARDHELSAVPQRLEHHLRRLPVPHVAASAAPLEVARAERPFGADALEHRLEQLGMLAERAVVPAPVPAALHDACGSAATARSAAATPRAPSTRRPARRARSCGTCSGSNAPMREESVSRCARSTVEIESSCTAERRRIAASTSLSPARR